MDEFLEELKTGEIQFRDRWQFELKAEFSPNNILLKTPYIQEFYFFIPVDLQVTPDTYSKQEFYQDLTNLIRYKTPYFTFKSLIDPKNSHSPLYQLRIFAKNQTDHKQVQLELKLLGNIFRSTLRTEVQKILSCPQIPEEEIHDLYTSIKQFEEAFSKTIEHFDLNRHADLKLTFGYLDEFIGNSIEYYLTGLLDELQQHHSPVPQSVEDDLCEMIIETTLQIEKSHKTSIKFSKERNEEILYRVGLLKKYFMDGLLLNIDKKSIQEKYGALISSFSAGVAMLVYLLLFIWQGQWFVINSEPFIVITVIAYILKDRLKDGLKALSYRHALLYFSDYTTKIRSPQEEVLGELKETFTFVGEDHIPEDIKNIRNKEFHAMMKTFKRPEQVIYFKRTVELYSAESKTDPRLKSINISLHYNLQDFLKKASDPYHTYVTLDISTRTLIKLHLPKVYHLNVIMKNQFTNNQNEKVTELKKFRLILDKNGIKNIETVRT